MPLDERPLARVPGQRSYRHPYGAAGQMPDVLGRAFYDRRELGIASLPLDAGASWLRYRAAGLVPVEPRFVVPI
jgi:hypothetical protein